MQTLSYQNESCTLKSAWTNSMEKKTQDILELSTKRPWFLIHTVNNIGLISSALFSRCLF